MKYLKKGLPIPGKPYLNQLYDGIGGYANTAKQFLGNTMGQMQGGMQGLMSNMSNVMGNLF